ncbi:MAG: type II toxin-antitoxin system VapC family toxin [Myxococcaceae bacterium]
MIAFIDSSVLLRKFFDEPDPLKQWSEITEAYASRLLPLEIGRVIDRFRLAGEVDDEEVAHLHEEARRTLRSIELRPITERILQRAAAPMPTTVGSLDAIHLATALEIATQRGGLVLVTHDLQLARAARASGLEVLGA